MKNAGWGIDPIQTHGFESFSSSFFQKYWPTIKDGLVDCVKEFFINGVFGWGKMVFSKNHFPWKMFSQGRLIFLSYFPLFGLR